MPPQHYLLNLIQRILAPSPQLSIQEKVIGWITKSDFGNFLFKPIELDRDAQGTRAIVYSGNERFGGPAGQRHRSLTFFGKEGVWIFNMSWEPSLIEHLSVTSRNHP
jgi:hypothetical protein